MFERYSNMTLDKKVISLPKGGYILETSAGDLQLGAPPETIKDSLALGRSVPRMYIAPMNLFSHSKMASLLEVEFPCNFNFFIARSKTTIFATSKQKSLILELLSEAIFGPANLHLENEYSGGTDHRAFPAMEKEMQYFTKHPTEDRHFTLADIVEIVILEPGEPTIHNGISVTLDLAHGLLQIEDKGVKTPLPWDIDLPELKVSYKESIFIAPSFGITTLGSSHGFDPKGKTSGFIFWVNGVGIMIDPPVDSALWLQEDNVDPQMVTSVILTHCHSDHDSGVMQKLLQQGRITLYTTPTIFSSFIKKISLLTALSEIEIIQLVDFKPLQIGKPVNINGASFTFSYRLHSIPTIGFEMKFKNKTITYTSDHLNDKNYFKKLYSLGILPKGRFEELSGFNWESDIIIHEAGIPPLHTPLQVLLELPESIKERIYLVHTDKSKIKGDTKLKISPTGLFNTMRIEQKYMVHGESIQILNIVKNLDIFQDISFAKAVEFLSILKYVKFTRGETMLKAGCFNRRFFIILAGRARIIQEGRTKAYLTSGSYFGEKSLIQRRKAGATIEARTDLITLVVEEEDFFNFFSNTPIIQKLNALSEIRKLGSWETLASNSLFHAASIYQINMLESLFTYCDSPENTTIIQSGKPMECALFWKNGKGEIRNDEDIILKELKYGDYIGNPAYLLGERIPHLHVVTASPASYFRVSWDKMLKFFQTNPGILLALKELNPVL